MPKPTLMPIRTEDMRAIRNAWDAAKSAYRLMVPSKIRRTVRPLLRKTRDRLFPQPPERRLFRSAMLSYKRWKLEEALATLNTLLDQIPFHIDALHKRSEILALMPDKQAAISACYDLLDRDPLDLIAIHRLKYLGQTYVFNRATAENAVSGEGRKAKVYLRAAQYLNEGGFYETAIENVRNGLATTQPGDVDLRAALIFEEGYATANSGDHAAAIAILAKVPEGTPSFRRAISVWGKSLLEMGRSAEAEEILRRIGAHDDGKLPAHGVVLAARLHQGKILEAHRMYRHRASSLALAEYFNMPRPPKEIGLRAGLHSDEDVLVAAEGGPGDEIRISSMYRELTAHCRSVTASCEPRLHTLLQRSFPEIEFVPTTRYRKEVLTNNILNRDTLGDRRLYMFVSDQLKEMGDGKQLVCSTLDLLADFRTSREDFKQAARLTPDPDLVSMWRSKTRRSGNVQVGLSWRSILMSRDRSRHYLKAEDLAPLSELQNVDFWLLQANITTEEFDTFERLGFRVNIPGIDMKDDFEGQAALLSSLDITVSPLSTMGELSVMVGTPTLLFCRTHEATWRRNSDGSDVWSTNSRLITGDPVWDITTLVQNLRNEIELFQIAG